MNLSGLSIVEVRAMTRGELNAEGWGDSPHPVPVLVLSNGSHLYPSRDPEGNGPGALFMHDAEGYATLQVSTE